MKRFLPLVFILVLTSASTAQSTFLWKHAFSSNSSDAGTHLVNCANGDFIVAGAADGTYCDFDPDIYLSHVLPGTSSSAFLARYTRLGELVWARKIESIGFYKNITTDADENIYLYGNFSGTVDIDPGPGVINITSAGGDNICVIKFSPTGQFLWVNPGRARRCDYRKPGV